LNDFFFDRRFPGQKHIFPRSALRSNFNRNLKMIKKQYLISFPTLIFFRYFPRAIRHCNLDRCHYVWVLQRRNFPLHRGKLFDKLRDLRVIIALVGHAIDLVLLEIGFLTPLGAVSNNFATRAQFQFRNREFGSNRQDRFGSETGDAKSLFSNAHF
jgi:hypothetical protein